MLKNLPVVCLALAVSLASGCGPAPKRPAAKTANAKISARAADDKMAVSSQKPATPTTTSTAPKPLPAPVTAGETTVKPADPTSGGTKPAITYAFSSVDLDGDGDQESGVVLADEALTTIVMWWSGTTIFDDGFDQDYDAVLWVTPQSTGMVMSFPGAGSVACADGVCVACDEGASTCVVQQ